MIVTRATDYAVRILVYLAGRQKAARALAESGRAAEFGRATRDEIVEGTRVPPAFLNKIVRRLVEAKLVAARPGVQGGCSLACAAAEITVLQVVVGMEGPVRLSECADDPSPCPRATHCSFRRLLLELQREMTRVLASKNIADLAEGGGQAVTCLRGRPAARQGTLVCGAPDAVSPPRKID